MFMIVSIKKQTNVWKYFPSNQPPQQQPHLPPSPELEFKNLILPYLRTTQIMIISSKNQYLVSYNSDLFQY